MEKKTFLEVMAGPEGLRLTRSQKRVLRKIIDTGNPKIAAEQIADAEDSENLIAAAKILARYGYITTEPEHPGEHEEPVLMDITDVGQQAVDDYDIEGDETLITPAEQQASAPGQEPGMSGLEYEPPGEEEFGEEPLEGEGGEEEGGEEEGDEEGEGEQSPEKEFGFEVSSFFQEINDLHKLMEKS